MTNLNIFRYCAIVAAIAAFGASAAEARIETYSNLTCRFMVGKFNNYDPGYNSVRITNTGNLTVPKRAGFTVSLAGKSQNVRLYRPLAPKEQATPTVGLSGPDGARCTTVAHWYFPDDYRPH
jgi:hypothetical protein